MISFWQNRKVFITGHTGFKGSWLSLWLQQLGANIIGYSLNPETTPNLFTIGNVSKKMENIYGDIRNFDLLEKSLCNFQPEIIIHMAAQSLVKKSYKVPVETFDVNVMGSVYLLQAARNIQSVKAIVNVTTDKCYENKETKKPYSENDPLGGYDPYSCSKACSELVTNAYRNSFFNERNIGVASARAGNVIGGGDWASDRIVPDIVRSFLKNQPVLVRNPNAFRTWQHVLEPLSGYLLLAEKLFNSPSQYAESWNFGPEESDVKPVSWIVERIIEQWKGNASWILDKTSHPHEAKNLLLNCKKSNEKLNWNTRWNLQRGLEETVDWYKAYQAGKSMEIKTIEQINKFMNDFNKKSENKNTCGEYF